MAAPICTGTVLGDRIDAIVQRMQSKHPANLAKLIAPGESYPQGAEEAFNAFFSHPGNSSEPLLRREPEWNNESALEATIKLVDDMFFYGLVRHKFTVTFETINPTTYGHTYVKLVNGLWEICIEIDLANQRSLLSVIRTLIHEMAHAFIKLYICKCGSQDCHRNLRRLDQLGLTEHGGYWQRLTSAAEVLNLEVGKVSIDLGRVIGARQELSKSVSEEEALAYLRNAFGVEDGDQMFSDWRARRARRANEEEV